MDISSPPKVTITAQLTVLNVLGRIIWVRNSNHEAFHYYGSEHLPLLPFTMFGPQDIPQHPKHISFPGVRSKVSQPHKTTIKIIFLLCPAYEHGCTPQDNNCKYTGQPNAMSLKLVAPKYKGIFPLYSSHLTSSDPL
jgi:hypothetical protein